MDGCWEGDYLAIEVKTWTAWKKNTHGLSEVQVRYALDILRSGGLWAVTYEAEHIYGMLTSGRIRAPEYYEETIADLTRIQVENQAAWSARRPKNRSDKDAYRLKDAPNIVEGLKEWDAHMVEVRRMKDRWNRRFGIGKYRRKYPLPMSLLLHGLSHDVEGDVGEELDE